MISLANLRVYASSNTLSQDKTQSSMSAFKTWVVLGLLIISVAALSFFVLSGESLRLDEAQSIWQSSHSPLGVINVIARDVHVPFYGLVLHFWQLFFGTGVATGRTLSLVFFLLSIPAMYSLGRAAYNKNVALFASILLATSPFLNWYGSEMRMYSLLLLLTILNQYFYVKIFQAGKNPVPQDSLVYLWWGFGLVSLLGIYTHYFFWLVLLTEGLFFLFNRQNFPKNSFRNFAVVAVLLVAAISPWILYARSQGGANNQTPALIPPSTIDFFNVFSQFIFGFQDDHVNTIIISLWPLSVLFAFLGLRKKKKALGPDKFFLVSAFVPIVIALAVSLLVRPVFLARYLILTVPALYLLIAWFFENYPPKVSFALKSILCALMVLTLYQQVASADTPTKENYQQASEYLNSHAGASDVIVLSAPFTIYPVEYYYSGQASITTLPAWNPYQAGSIPAFNNSDLPNQVDAAAKTHENVWLLLSYNQGYQSEILNYFESHFQRLEYKNFSPRLDLYEYKIRY